MHSALKRWEIGVNSCKQPRSSFVTFSLSVTYSTRRNKSVEKHSAEELMIIYQQKSPELAARAFLVLYRRYGQRVYSFLLKKCRNQADAEDLLQKVFIKVHESKHLYKSEFKFEQWLFVIARTSVLDSFRSHDRYAKRIKKWGSEHQGHADLQNSKNEDSLQSLSADQKEMLEMKYIDDLTYQEMARHFNKSEGSLRKTVSRLLINLRKGEA